MQRRNIKRNMKVKRKNSKTISTHISSAIKENLFTILTAQMPFFAHGTLAAAQALLPSMILEWARNPFTLFSFLPFVNFFNKRREVKNKNYNLKCLFFHPPSYTNNFLWTFAVAISRVEASCVRNFKCKSWYGLNVL